MPPASRLFAHVGLALVVLFDDGDLAAGDRHRSLGRIFEAHHQAGLRLLAVGLQRAGLAVDMRDLEVGLRLRDRLPACGQGQSGDSRSDEGEATARNQAGVELRQMVVHGTYPQFDWKHGRDDRVGAPGRCANRA
jgi:hypothetical protein